MIKIFAATALVILSFFSGTARAGEIRELVLKDGSVITGEVVSLNNGVYTVKSSALGTIKLEESNVRIVREKASSAGETKDLQQKMLSDKEIMSLIGALQNDPEFQKLLEDPAFMKAVNDGDTAALTADPRFIRILNNPTVQEIQKKVRKDK
jgi:hypothetical protein